MPDVREDTQCGKAMKKKKPKFDPGKIYIITVKFIKKGDKIEPFISELKKRSDWIAPWWANEKI